MNRKSAREQPKSARELFFEKVPVNLASAREPFYEKVDLEYRLA